MKRGQIYILAALLLGFVIFILMSQTNTIQKIILENDFKEISKNYEQESKEFLNQQVLDENQDIEDNFKDFTNKFTEYAHSQKPNFGLIYILNYKGTNYIANYLDTSITVQQTQLEGYFQPTQEASGGISGAPSVNSNILCYEHIDDTDPQSQCHYFGTISTQNFNLQIEEYDYPIQISSNAPELVIVSKQEESGHRQVFISGEFLQPR